MYIPWPLEVDIFMIRVLRPEYCGPFENSYNVMIHKTLDLNITFTYFNLVRHEDFLRIYGRSHMYGPYGRERRPSKSVIIDSNVARIDFVIGEQYLRDGRDKFLFEFTYQPSRKKTNSHIPVASLRYVNWVSSNMVRLQAAKCWKAFSHSTSSIWYAMPLNYSTHLSWWSWNPSNSIKYLLSNWFRRKYK